ncbi:MULTISPECIES: Crp/Fnr family transcriptional regulator [Myroides]|uniref:Crp/Fnr family transcriptional regulator n=1 Tax=Myroides albus TaxID=2562892 RepID=A0A6I3LLS6_9FLAO|nr:MULTISPECIES: Crp/Fnr family transcriptional regulator [Myroides]MTG96935.1 Crp/Fnr family transcriptional regulator [Myroides albus]MVX35372.1 Crp/Fnr family transcriptional regulator [Myroides sp. LoEW2-1]UVD78314.1 Crp/Fnr family transcriptional regulator [Myroides albus]
MDLLLKSIANHVKLTKEEEQIVLESFTITRYPAKTKLLNAGEVCINSSFVISGILRNYCMDDQTVEHTMSFATTGWWMADMYSFLSQEPGQSYIEVVEDAIVMTLTRDHQLSLFDRVPKMERYFRILIERSLVANQQRLMDNMSLSAEVRYERFCERFPTIKFCLPQKQIASYLGITPEFFSKMKKRMLQGK